MTARSRAIGCSANWNFFARCQYGKRYLVANVDEDLPALDALQF